MAPPPSRNDDGLPCSSAARPAGETGEGLAGTQESLVLEIYFQVSTADKEIQRLDMVRAAAFWHRGVPRRSSGAHQALVRRWGR